MGTNTLTSRSTGEVILESFFNDFNTALSGDFVGRNTGSGAAESGKNLGTNALPWGTLYTNSIVLDGSAVDTSLLTAPKNRVVSGATKSGSNQPQFITPNGAAASFTLDGATTNLVLDINGTAVTVSTDITVSSLTVGPSTTETALIDDSDAADQDTTRTWGEYNAEKETITVDTMGAEFQAFIGQWQIISHGSEYFLGYVKSTTEITNCYRGWFTNSSGTAVNRDVFSNNDTLTVLSTGWVFVENNGTTVDVSYTTPVRAFTSPTSPSTGDYWYDIPNEVWKRYDGASWQTINRTLVGVVGIDSSNCVCARSFDFYQKHSNTNTLELNINSTEIIDTKGINDRVTVYGNNFRFGFNAIQWNITTDLADSADLYDATEQSSTLYYLHLKDTGEPVITDIEPQYRPDLDGWYNPQNPWRCVGITYNDGSSNLTLVDEMLYNPNITEKNLYAKDVKATNTHAGSASAGINDRDITELSGDTEIGSLSSNVVSILPGIYLISGRAPAYQVNAHKAYLYSNTDSQTDVRGNSGRSASGDSSTNFSSFDGKLKVSKVTAHIVKHWVQTAKATEGLGHRSVDGQDEIYTEIHYKKIG